MKQVISLLCIAVFGLSGCSTSPPPTAPLPATSSQKNEFNHLYQSWAGVPYQFGGSSKLGIDCSAFMQVTMAAIYQLNLPRTTELQSEQGIYIPESKAAFGDLVFFKTGWNQRHVGMYIGNKQFVHASTSKGVIISRLDNPYWASKFWQFRRMDALE
ncbi:NlpC/P60 family protein [Vibrio aphrogenes]|uniref:NlpC/P60 family protein n=1 Tax=Vibrio aphrogenes TaxID=1891186 RepID=UPI000B3573AA|nr:NlpC/P60 family protein [Vibrio aphrogenes]